MQNIVPVVDTALQKAFPEIATSAERLQKLDAIAFTQAPGLIGSLLVGAQFAKSLALSLQKPLIAVHHMQAHVLANLIPEHRPSFPFLCLTVSGGHTQIVLANSPTNLQIIGETIDDAAGEAFDKTAKLMGLEYPGGPLLAKLATQGQADKYAFPRPMTDRPGLNFSFSGLKTAAANVIAAEGKSAEVQADIAASFQQAVVDTLVLKCRRALKEQRLKRLVVAGGVSANTSLREQLEVLLKSLKGEVYYPRKEFCTDNGAMIAFAGFQRLRAGQQQDLTIGVTPRWPMEQLPAL